MFRTLPQRAQGTRPEIGLLLSGTLAPADTRPQRRIQYLIAKELLSRLSFLTGRPQCDKAGKRIGNQKAKIPGGDFSHRGDKCN